MKYKTQLLLWRIGIFLFAILLLRGCMLHDDPAVILDEDPNTVCYRLNTNIKAIHSIVNAKVNDEAIVDASSFSDVAGSGISVTFEGHTAIKVYYNDDLKTLSSMYYPVLGVRQETDGSYYWTLDGEWLLDDEEKKIAVITAGANSNLILEEMTVPEIKYDNGDWYISTDNRELWRYLWNDEEGKAKMGRTSNTDFWWIEVSTPHISFILSDGTTFHFDSSADSCFLNKITHCLTIGDSVTQGHVYDYPFTPEGGVVDTALSYPFFLSKMTDWEIENAGKAGISTNDWWKNKFNQYNYADYELVIIELGYNKGLTNSLDRDVNSKSFYQDYADTNTGAYCKIIEGILEQNPEVKIVLNISPLLNITAKLTIWKIAEKYSLQVINLADSSFIDLNDDRYHGATNRDGKLNRVHFNIMGYCAKALLIYHELSRILK